MTTRTLIGGLFLTISTCSIASAQSLRIDMNNPRRAVGREDDIRVDAQLNEDSVVSGTPISLTCQVENLGRTAIALSESVTADYDLESRTINLSVGSEVPNGGVMPRMVIVPSGGKQIFAAAPTLHVAVGGGSRYAPTPRYVQINVHVLRDLTPFREVIEKRAHSSQPVALSDELFSKWLESNDTIALNAMPVRYEESKQRNPFSADAPSGAMSMSSADVASMRP